MALGTAWRLTAAVTGVLGVGWLLLRGNGIEHANVAFDISPDGRRIVFSAADGDLYVHALGTREVVRLTQSPGTESGPRYSPDGKSIVYSASDPAGKGSSLYVIAATGGAPKRITNTSGTWDASPAFSPDGKTIAFSRGFLLRPYSMGGYTWDKFDLCTVRADGSGLRRLTTQKFRSLSNTYFSPRGTDILFSAYMNLYPRRLTTTVYRVDNAHSGTPVEVTTGQPEPADGGAWADSLAISRAGDRLAVVSDRQEPYAYDVWLLSMNGKPIRGLGVTKVARYNQCPVFSPDGKKVLYLAGTETGAGNRAIYSLWEVGVDGRDARKLADSGLFSHPSTWKK